jgi:hypothetical protein
VPLAFRSWESRRCIDRDRDRADLQTRSRPATAPPLLVCGLSGRKADDWRGGTSASGLNLRLDRAHRRSACLADKREFAPIPAVCSDDQQAPLVGNADLRLGAAV